MKKVGITYMRNAGSTIWFTGLSGAGKSTLAMAVEHYLKTLDSNVETLDADVVRTHLSKGLGFSRFLCLDPLLLLLTLIPTVNHSWRFQY
jgi:adenylylsulfate kinase-like enzyme